MAASRFAFFAASRQIKSAREEHHEGENFVIENGKHKGKAGGGQFLKRGTQRQCLIKGRKSNGSKPSCNRNSFD